MKKTLFLFVFLYSFLAASAQEGPEMADLMYSNGKIYVVVGVILLIFAGIIAYLVAIDRKVSRVERELKEKQK
ncbi:MAG: CcmD family protein [Bacteroidota bacterium]